MYTYFWTCILGCGTSIFDLYANCPNINSWQLFDCYIIRIMCGFISYSLEDSIMINGLSDNHYFSNST